MESFVERLKARGLHVILCGVRQGIYDTMKKTGMAAKLGEKEIVLEAPVRLTSTLLAVRHAYELVHDLCPTCPRRDLAVREAELYYMI